MSGDLPKKGTVIYFAPVPTQFFNSGNIIKLTSIC